MRKLYFFIVILILSGCTLYAEEIYFLTDPAITPDAKTLVFCYEGDLWKVDSAGGLAGRITAMEGNEVRPRISPDGKWLTFSGGQDGNHNIYVMPLAGGIIKQLTFNDGFDYVDSWSWDSKYIYFTSNRYNDFAAYKVSIDGGTPLRLVPGYFNTIHGVVEDPLTKGFYYTDTWESWRFAHRKRYKGDYNPDIKYLNPTNKEYKQLTDYNGKDLWPTVDRNGAVYFASDEANSEYNLYTFKNGKKVQLTGFETSMKNPLVNADGTKVVFEKDYQIFIYDIAESKTVKVPIVLYRNDTLKIEQDFNTNGNITNLDVSPDGKKIAFPSRGELFVSDIEGKFITELPTARAGRVMEVHWLSDNKTIIFNQTVGGYQNWFTISADKSGSEKQLTFDAENNRNLSFNSDRTKAVFLGGRNSVKLMDMKNFKSEVLLTEELWDLYNPVPRFSPDDRYIAFTAHRNFEQDILLYDLQSKKTINLTNTGLTETQPYWSPDGKYLYFVADRYQNQYPRGTGDLKIYRLPLEKFSDPFRSDEYAKLFIEEKKDKKDQKKDKNGPKETKQDKKGQNPVKIDFSDFWERWEQVSPPKGEQNLPIVLIKDDETTMLFISDHDGEKDSIWKTVYKKFEEPKTEKIKDSELDDNIDFSISGDKVYTTIKGNIYEIDYKNSKLKPIKINNTFRRNLRDEFNQMFYETWANMEVNFYDEKFHGVDWLKIRKRYEAFLPYITSRENLRILIGDMLGELNTSHFGFYSSGKEEETFYRSRTMQTGVVFDEADPFIVKEIIKNSAADKKEIDIRAGDQLISINSKDIDPKKNREEYFLAPSLDQEIEPGFMRDGKKFTAKIKPESSGELRSQLYDAWEDERQVMVDKSSNGQIAYIHMKNMGPGSLNKFIIEMTTEWYHKDALILDLRYNTGGNVHNDILQYLSQRPYMTWKYRGGSPASQPHFAPADKPIILLINEQSLSDAEVTASGFKALKLGTLIGTETYRWIIFTSGKLLVDGSYYRLPSWGCFNLEGQDLEKTGVKPDIYIKNTIIDRIEGKDPQLDRAIDEIMKQLKK